MAETKDTRISGYYAELNKFIENANYQKIIKTANKIIAEQPEELKAWQCKIVAQIQQNQFQEALSTVKKSKFTLELAFEKAYCEYRLNDVEAAFETINSATDVTPRVQELKAQILYRLEKYTDCYGIYRDIIRTTSDDFDMERQTNMTAVAVNRSFEGSNEDDTVEVDSSTYELLYNGSCQLLALNRVEEALAKLQATEKLCRTYLMQEEGATEEDVNEEVAIIRVQQAHCLQLLGREKDALTIYNNVLKNKPDDPALLAIINNNLVAINRGSNVFDSRKRMKTAMAPGLEHKLTSYQRSRISLNNCLLAYHSNQDDVCRSEAKRLADEHPALALEVSVIKAALLGRDGKTTEAHSVLNKCAKNHPDESTSICLMATQILLNQGDRKGACEMLMSLSDKDRYRQGIVSALVTLCMASGDHDGASNILRQAVEWHKKSKTSSVLLGELWRNAADFHLRRGDAPTAAASLQELRKINPGDVNTLAQLITAFAQYDVKSAQSLSRELPPVKNMTSGIDVEALEASIGQKYFKKMHQARGEASPASPASPKAAMTPGDIKKTKSKKKRKPRLPKDYNPNITPDPERWLPKWQRKGYRKKKDRRVKEVMKGTQGVSSDAADKFDITKTAGTYKTAQATPSPQPESSGMRRNMKKKATGKNRKKGVW